MYRVLSRLDLVIYLVVFRYCLRAPRPGWQYIVGMILAAIGFVSWLIARAQLGESFSAKPQARELITTGLYSKIRNPIYIFSTLGLAGICFGMHWYKFGSLYIASVLIVQWRRSKAEAAILEAAFGDRYRHYRAQTWF